MDLGTCMHKKQILSSLKGEIPMRPPPFSILQPPLIHERKFLSIITYINLHLETESSICYADYNMTVFRDCNV
jgi:hypothetical protein